MSGVVNTGKKLLFGEEPEFQGPEPWSGYKGPYGDLSGEAKSLYGQGPQKFPDFPTYVPTNQDEQSAIGEYRRVAGDYIKAGKGLYGNAQNMFNTGQGYSQRGLGLADMAMGRASNFMGQQGPQLQNYGGWRQGLGSYMSGQISPYARGMVGAAQDDAFRQHDRSSQGMLQDWQRAAEQSQGNFEANRYGIGSAFDREMQGVRNQYGQQVDDSMSEFGRQQLGAQSSLQRMALTGKNAYQRAVTPALNDIRDQMATLQRDFGEKTLPAIRGAASQVGGYGGSRQGIAEGIAARGMGEQAMRSMGRLGEGLGIGAGQFGESLGLAAAQTGEGLGLSSGETARQLLGGADRTAQSMGLGRGQAAESLALANSQMGRAQGLGAAQMGQNIYQSGAQAADLASNIGSRMYGDLYENAQNRGLQAAQTGGQLDMNYAGLLQQERNRASNAALGFGGLASQYGGLGQNYMSSGVSGVNQYMQGLGQSGNLYAQAGGIGRERAEDELQQRIARFQDPYRSQWEHLSNYQKALFGGSMPMGGSWSPGSDAGPQALGAGAGIGALMLMA